MRETIRLCVFLMSKSYLLTSVQWDCPSALCSGWLDVYGFENGSGKKPTIKWVQCSQKCGGQFIISKFQASKPCPACSRPIAMVG